MKANGIDRILESYGIRVIPRMFAYEKKILYMLFIGLNRSVMHDVLD